MYCPLKENVNNTASGKGQCKTDYLWLSFSFNCMLKRKLFTGHASYLLVAETMLEAGNTNWKSM